MQRIHPNRTDWFLFASLAVHSAAAFGCPQVPPVGRTIASSSEPFRVDEGFQQYGTLVIGPFPIAGELFGHQAQDVTGEAFDLDPRQKQEARILDDPLKPRLAGLRGPSNPAISFLESPGRRGKLEASQHARLRFDGLDDIAKAGTKGRLETQLMIAINEFLPKRSVLGGCDMT